MEASMSRVISRVLLCVLAIAFVQSTHAASVEQQLVVVSNAKTLGGAFQVAVQVKGTDLPAANTLGSATIDVEYDNTKLTYVNSTLWAFATADGYTRSANNIGTFIRIAVTGGGVNGDGGGLPAGFDIGTTYTTWVQINFTIADPSGTTNLTIASGSNAIGIFENQSNEPLTGVINNQPLSAPINIGNEQLPVQLSSFTAATIQSSGGVLLKWTTLSETNNYGFEIQKSLEGSDTWQTIEGSFVAGNGTTLETHSYSYTDMTASPGAWYYRLKQIDLDDAIHYSESIKPSGVTGVKEKEIPKEFALDQNYPNPFNPSTVINFALPRESMVSLEVYNLIGQRVAVLVNEVKPAGYHSLRFNGASFSSGIYFYSLVTGDTKFLRKMVLVK
jgi:hypothetical protein